MGNTSITEGRTALNLGSTSIKRGKTKIMMGNSSISRGKSTTSLGSSTITSGKTKISLGVTECDRGLRNMLLRGREGTEVGTSYTPPISSTSVLSCPIHPMQQQWNTHYLEHVLSLQLPQYD
ncbi:hypothetical protein P4O66_000701 [Electrophorus voltai]|uniref:Uncharacterized protein n=1 Tax=Electrophorus voltai TaxID=2609070 RepID=A0AAD8ZEU4_9TELE|nr:hypothetical protein P4O66_000701 [Electrophorus voltai]